MNGQQFDDWRQWAAELDDTEFANVFFVLGLVAGTSIWATATKKLPLKPLVRKWRWRGSDKWKTNPLNLVEWARHRLPITAAEIAINWLIRHQENTGAPPVLTWRFPQARLSGEQEPALALTEMTPQEWAEVFRTIRENHADGFAELRLRVVELPETEPAGRWLKTLMRTNPPLAAVSVSLNLDPNQTEADATDGYYPPLALDWPLRLGDLPESNAQEVFDYLQSTWPSSGLTRKVPLNRTNANCDLLVHLGDVETLLAVLQAQPFPCKTNILLMAGAGDADPPTQGSAVRRIIALTQASGAILLGTQDPSVMGDILNQFMNKLSHNLSFDRAWTAVLRNQYRPDNPRQPTTAVLLLTDELANFQISKLAENLKRRVENLPAGTKLDLPAYGSYWYTITPPASEIPRTDRGPSGVEWADAPRLSLDLNRLDYHRESDGASELAAFATIIKGAEEPLEIHAKRAARFLQQQSYLLRRDKQGYEPATHGFVLGRIARVKLRIGPSDEAWQSLERAFSVETLPIQSRWQITVVLTEPDQIGDALSAKITLPRDGASTSCDFDFSPKREGAFEGCITVLHRGRVLQTAMLRAQVVAEGATANSEATPRLEDVAVIRHRLGDLDERTQFDAALIERLAKTEGGLQVQAVAAMHSMVTPVENIESAPRRVGLMNIADCLEIAKNINTKLSGIALSVDDFQGGLDSEEGSRLFTELALEGATLYLTLFSAYFEGYGRPPEIAKQEYLQIVTIQADKTIPYEFIYEHEVPGDDAKPCAQWRTCLEAGKLATGCQGGTAKAVCPLGFWGLSKVIERHRVKAQADDEAAGVFLQSEPSRERDKLRLTGSALFASSSRVKAGKADVESELKKWLGTNPSIADDWENWAQIVADIGPHMIVALPHIEGSGAAITLEINDKPIRAIQIKQAHLLKSKPPPINPPLVALLGCDTAGTGNDYGSSVLIFRTKGAAVVIATIATVYTEHSARVATLLVKLLSETTNEECLGVVIRKLKRQALLENLLMPLCLVAYGDADWKLVGKPA